MTLVCVAIIVVAVAGVSSVIAMLIAEERMYRLMMKEIRRKHYEDRIYNTRHTTDKEELTADHNSEP